MMNEQSKDEKTVPLISKIGPLAGLLAAAITVYSNLPIVLQYIMVFLLAVITFVSIYAVFGEPVIKFVKKKAMAKKNRILTKKYSEKFNKFVDRFGELIKDDRTDTILYVLNKLQSNKKYAAILTSNHDFMRAFNVFHRSIGKLYRTKENFLILIGWFESIVNLCNEHLFCRPIERIRTIGREEIPEQVREDYERCKEIYNKFMDNYMDFAKDMNKQFAENVARDHFQVPKGL